MGDEDPPQPYVDDDDDDDDWSYESPTHAKLQAYLPKPFALISIVSSYAMIRELYHDHKVRNQGSPIKRMLLSVAVADVLFSLAWFLGTWMAPNDIANDEMIGNNLGNHTTCTIEGVLLTVGMLASQLSNAALSIFCLLVVRYEWTDKQLHSIEWITQSVVWLWAFISAIYPIPLQLYNIDGKICYVESEPPGCTTSEDCDRGSDPTYHQLYQAVMPILCLLVSTSIMISLTLKVRQVENKTNQYTASFVQSSVNDTNNDDNDGYSSAGSLSLASIRSSIGGALTQQSINRKKSRAVARQGMFYALAFLGSYLFAIISMLWYVATGHSNNVFDAIAWSVCYPSTGTFNFLVFIRLRRSMRTPEGRVLRAIVCCCCQKDSAKGGRGSTTTSMGRNRIKHKNHSSAVMHASVQNYNPSAVMLNASSNHKSSAGDSEVPHPEAVEPVEHNNENSDQGENESGEELSDMVGDTQR